MTELLFSISFPFLFHFPLLCKTGNPLFEFVQHFGHIICIITSPDDSAPTITPVTPHSVSLARLFPCLPNVIALSTLKNPSALHLFFLVCCAHSNGSSWRVINAPSLLRPPYSTHCCSFSHSRLSFQSLGETNLLRAPISSLPFHKCFIQFNPLWHLKSSHIMTSRSTPFNSNFASSIFF